MLTLVWWQGSGSRLQPVCSGVGVGQRLLVICWVLLLPIVEKIFWVPVISVRAALLEFDGCVRSKLRGIRKNLDFRLVFASTVFDFQTNLLQVSSFFFWFSLFLTQKHILTILHGSLFPVLHNPDLCSTILLQLVLELNLNRIGGMQFRIWMSATTG